MKKIKKKLFSRKKKLLDISLKSGLSPGTLVHIGEKKTQELKIRVVSYNMDEISTHSIENLTQINEFIKNNKNTWIQVIGFSDMEIISNLGELFKIDKLILEDIVNTKHRPKYEFNNEYESVILKHLKFADDGDLISEQISMVLGNNYLLSFHEIEDEHLSYVMERLNGNIGNIRSKSCDYLFYRIMDIITDNYFIISENFRDQIESIEELTIDNANSEYISNIQHLKKQLYKFRKTTIPLREITSKIIKEDTNFIKNETIPYIKDLFEHLVHITENIEIQIDNTRDLIELIHSNLNLRLNKMIEALTIISFIFIPLTFIAGIYGMNFDYIPELKLEYGYFYVWGIITIITIFILIYLRRKSWI